MKMRTFNHLIAIISVLTNLLATFAVFTGQHTIFGKIAVSIAMLVSLGMYLRVVVGTAAMQVADKQEKLVQIAIAQEKSPDVVKKFTEWIEDDDMDFLGAKICEMVEARDSKTGESAGYWILLVGSQSTYEKIRKELKDDCTVLNYWPMDREDWAQQIKEAYLDDEIWGPDEAIPELKG